MAYGTTYRAKKLKTYKPESYKGVLIRFIENIIGKNKYVTGSFRLKTKTYKVKGLTKSDASTKAKKYIDRIL